MNERKLDRKHRKALLERYANDSDILAAKDKYSKNSLNPLANLKNKKLENQEIDKLLIQKEKARKLEEKRIREEKKKEEQRIKKEKLKASFQKHKLLYFISFTIVLIAFIVGYFINRYRSTIREIHFINTPEVQYIGDQLKCEYEVIPNTAKYTDGEITIKFIGDNLLEDNNLVKEGSLVASVIYNNKEFDKTSIKVQPIKIASIKQDDINVGIGNKLTIEPTIEPVNATNKEYSLANYNEEIISIKENEIEGLSLGTTRLTINSVDGITKTINVNVIEIPPTKLTMSGIFSTNEVGDTGIVKVEYTPKETTQKEVSFSSSDKSVITIDEEGNFEVVGIGETTITVKYNDDVKCEKDVTVIYPACESISLSANNYNLYVGNTTSVYCSFTPYYNRDKDSLSYSSSNASILEVNDKGIVTAKSLGTATITAKCGKCTNSIEIKVVEKPIEGSTSSNNGSSGSGSTHIEGDGVTVYITPYGKVYHKDPSCPASDNVSGVPLSSVEGRMSPCKKCWR